MSKTIKSRLKSATKGIIIALIGLIVIIFISLLIGSYGISHVEQSRQLGQWLLDKGTLFLAWRLRILLAIFFIWPFIIRYRIFAAAH